MRALANGDLIAGGWFTSLGGIPVKRIARWNGATWTPFGVGVNNEYVDDIATLPNGDVVVGGPFTVVSGQASRYLARIGTTCPASVVAFGSGCAGAGGVDTLTATTLPWIGSTFRATATGMPPLAFVAIVTGFTQFNIPLSSVLPGALPGCQGLVAPDIVEVLFPAGGVVQPQLTIPNVAFFVGVQVHQAVVPFELDANSQLVAITSSNALTLTLGAF